MNIGSDAFKAEGNKMFKEGRFEDAIIAYNKAISINDRISIYYSNWSRALKMLGKL